MWDILQLYIDFSIFLVIAKISFALLQEFQYIYIYLVLQPFDKMECLSTFLVFLFLCMFLLKFLF